MAASIERNLGILAQHAIWSRDTPWLRQWYEKIFVPTCAESAIASPLAALDICSALDRGARREGKFAAGRVGFTGWCQFLEELNAVVHTQGSTQSAAKQIVASRRTLRAFSLSLMSREWEIEQNFWQSSGHVMAERMLAGEAARLSGAPTPNTLRGLWAVLDGDATKHALRTYLAPSVWLNLTNRNTKPIDPFLFHFLALSAEGDELPRPAILGSQPQAIHSRRRIGAAGEFAKRDLGQLPSNLARLAPTELMFFAEAANSDKIGQSDMRPAKRTRSSDGKYATEITPISSAALRSLFVMKTSEGRLLQRFSFEAEPSTMEPSGMLQVEIADIAEYHVLQAKDGAPAITWFRAVAVQLVHQFARFAADSRWAVANAISYSFNHRYSVGIIPLSYRATLAESVSNTLQLLVSTNARAFQAGWPGVTEQIPPENRFPPEMDFCIRIVLGSPDESAEQPNSLLVRPRQQWGARIEKAPNGLWGLAISGETAAAPALVVTALNETEANPAVAATIILKAILTGTSDQQRGGL